MKKNFVLLVMLAALLPLQIFAQNRKDNLCYDENCVLEILKDMKSADTVIANKAEKDFTEVVDNYVNRCNKRTKNALIKSTTMFAEKFPNDKCTNYILSQMPKFCTYKDLDAFDFLLENDRIADRIIRIIGDIKGSADYILKYINEHKANLQYKGALAYAIGKQQITSMEDELVLWLKDADIPAKIDIYNALVVIKSNENTEKIIIKGAKKLNKNKVPEYKIAGMRLLVTMQGEQALPVLYKALKHKDGNVRREALELMKPFANQEVVDKVVKKCKSGEALTDVINWMGDIKNDSYIDLIIQQLTLNDKNNVKAAIIAIFKIDNPKGIAAVKPMFGGNYQDVIYKSMLAYKGDYRAVLDDLMSSGKDKQKLASLQILESRHDGRLYMRVQDCLYSNNDEVSDLAYKVLKLVAGPANAEALKSILENCDEKYIGDVQLAIRAAMMNVPASNKDTYVSTLKHVRSDLMPRYYKVFAYFGTELCVEKLIDAYQNGAYQNDAREALILVDNEKLRLRIAEVINN